MLRKFVLSLVLAISLILSACVPSNPISTEAPAATFTSVVETISPTSEPTEVPLFPLTVTDGAGRQVTFDAAPEHIVSLSPSNTEILFAVGAGELVVGDTEYCDYPSEAALLPKVGGYSADSISIETILSLEADLVLADGSGQEAVIEALEQADVHVIALDAASLEEVYANIEMVGKITGHAVDATTLVDDMKARVAVVEEKVASIPEEDRVTVFWEIWDEPLMTAGPNTFIGQMIEMAGGVNIFAGLTEDYPQVSAEEVVESNPAFILGPDSHGDKLIAEQLAVRPGWDQIDAVMNNNIFLIDGNISSRPGPRIVDALEAIATSLYPDLFE
jgi:iron complex transport system substrate-binding protein